MILRIFERLKDSGGKFKFSACKVLQVALLEGGYVA
jgi:hypothetical protein